MCMWFLSHIGLYLLWSIMASPWYLSRTFVHYSTGSAQKACEIVYWYEIGQELKLLPDFQVGRYLILRKSGKIFDEEWRSGKFTSILSNKNSVGLGRNHCQSSCLPAGLQWVSPRTVPALLSLFRYHSALTHWQNRSLSPAGKESRKGSFVTSSPCNTEE